MCTFAMKDKKQDMKRILLTAAMFVVMAMMAVAQEIKFTEFKNEAHFTAPFEGKTWYVHNSLKIDLPKKEGNEALPTNAITQSILANAFPLLEDHSRLTSIEAIKNFMRSYVISSNISTKPMKPHAPMKGYSREMFANVEVKMQCIEKGILTMCVEWQEALFDLSDEGKEYFYIDVNSGNELNGSAILGDEAKSKILTLLESISNVKKYSCDRAMDNDLAKMVAEDVREVRRNPYKLTCFYVNQEKVHVVWNLYELGLHDFDIPLSVIGGSGTTQSTDAKSNAAVKSQIPSGKIYTVVEKEPEYPGGEKAMWDFISKNLKYPDDLVETCTQGRVNVKFVVTAQGELVNAEIVSSPHNSLSKEALRIVSLMPRWTPGKQGGKAVNAYYTLTLTFRLM